MHKLFFDNALDLEFSQLIDLDNAYVFFREAGSPSGIFGYYLPIPQELFNSYGRLDTYLHAQWAIPIGLPDDKWRKESSRDLRVFAETLVPHANPKNSLEYLRLPNVKFREVEVDEAKNILKRRWRDAYFGV